jgi:predicted histidine transporter YuiF (NhaC family)
MDDELFEAASMSVTALVVAVVLGLLMLTVVLAMVISSLVVNRMSDAQNSSYVSSLISATDYNKPIPAPVAYTILENNTSIIDSISGEVDGNSITTLDQLKDYPSDKVYLMCTEEHDGRFNVQISD